MTLDEWKKLPYKYNSDSDIVTNGDMLGNMNRSMRRKIEQKLKKGKTPDLQEFLEIEQ